MHTKQCKSNVSLDISAASTFFSKCASNLPGVRKGVYRVIYHLILDFEFCQKFKCVIILNLIVRIDASTSHIQIKMSQARKMESNVLDS